MASNMHQFFKGEFFNFEAVRLLGTATYGGADIAEFLEAVASIKNDDPDSWHRAWKIQAERAEALAEQARQSGDVVAARRAYLRASNYTRASGYMFTGGGPNKPDSRLLPVCERVIALFRKATKLFDCSVHFLEIPYDGHKLPGYLYLPPASRRLPGKVPILISSGGADAVQEELYYMHPAAGPDQGYAVVTFEGPGQGIMLRRHGLPMRPDWEVVTGAVIDYLEAYSGKYPELELDLNRVAIAGASLGGYYALRAASDPRIKVCVALDPLYDFWDFAMSHVSPTFISAWMKGWLSNGVVDLVISTMMRLAFQMRWEVGVAGTFFGISSPAAIMLEMKKYTLSLPGGGSFLERVRCPVLVSGAGMSLYLDANHHTMRVFNSLKVQKEGDKQIWMATNPGEGGLQAKMGALGLSNQRTYRFLDEKFSIVRQELFPAR